MGESAEQRCLRSNGCSGVAPLSTILRPTSRIEREQRRFHLPLFPVQSGEKLPSRALYARVVHQCEVDLECFGQYTTAWRNVECHSGCHFAIREKPRPLVVLR